ncbi:MAG: PEP-CTERM sorting domain-containing protein [Alphaproteobacteria bacterium]|nr:PEP-CTERM sorting domain-containing protein [Alphaproteobacteria bacterium]
MKFLLGAIAILAALTCSAEADTILFVGNSFTYGELASAKFYHAREVHDLNPPNERNQTIGGVPAIFKEFTKEANLSYDVSLETVGGKGLDFHYTEKLPLLDKPWDAVVLQSYSTLDENNPGDPKLLTEYTRKFDATLHARNPNVKIYLNATWSRADLIYPADAPWSGKPITQMALDIAAGYEAARKASPGIAGIAPVGQAWNRAFATGVADPNPYDGISAGQVNLWAEDAYHASDFGYYLEALVIFGKVTGLDPLSLGPKERVARDFGFSPRQTTALQQVAHDELAAQK